MIKKEILKICSYTNNSYLEKILFQLKNDENKKEQVKILFNKHMQEISDLCFKYFFNENKLNESFLRKLHKNHFPAGYKEIQKKDGIEIVCMIPGVYRSNENFFWVEAKNVKSKMKELIDDYNENIDLVENKYDFILSKLINFLRIHPFGNGNGRIISIIIDLMLLKNNMKPIYFKYIQEKNKDIFKEMIIKSIKTQDIKHIKKIIN